MAHEWPLYSLIIHRYDPEILSVVQSAMLHAKHSLVFRDDAITNSRELRND